MTEPHQTERDCEFCKQEYLAKHRVLFKCPDPNHKTPMYMCGDHCMCSEEFLDADELDYNTEEVFCMVCVHQTIRRYISREEQRHKKRMSHLEALLEQSALK